MAKQASKRLLRELESLSESYFPDTKKALGAMYDAWAGNPAVRSMIDGINVGSVSPGQFMTTVIQEFQHVTPAVQHALVRNGVRAGEVFAQMYGMDMDLNSELWARQFAGQRISTLRDTSIDSVRTYVTRSLETGAPLTNLTNDLKGVVKLDQRWSTAAVNRHNALIARSGGRRSVQRNQSAYINRAARIKAEQIARTELAIAANHGRYQSLYAAKAVGLLDGTDLMVWIAHPDCCPMCSSYDGITASIDEGFGFATSAAFPPLHPNCRCTFGLK